MQSTKPVKVFISYANADKELRQKLEEHLSLLKHSGKIVIWKDQQILPGANWDHHIQTHLKDADMILLLVSASFIASNYCWDREVQKALELHKAGTVRLIPIILRPVDNWQSTPLGQLLALPTGARPVTQWDDQDAAFEAVAQGIRRVVEEILPLLLPAQEKQNIPPNMLPPRQDTTPNSDPHNMTLHLASIIQSPSEKVPQLASSPKPGALAYDSINTEPAYIEPVVQAADVLVTHRRQTPWLRVFPPGTLKNKVPFFPPQRHPSRKFLVRGSLTVTIILLSAFVLQGINHTSSQSTPIQPTSTANVLPTPILVDGDYIGISDGCYAFDTNRSAGSLMVKASESLKNGNRDDALDKWNAAHDKDTSDAEPLIYAADQQILKSHSPYISIVLGVSLSVKVDDGFSRSALQGAYIIQKEWNDNPQLFGEEKLYLLIASSGSNPDRSVDVAKQIKQVAQLDKTIVGVQGWTTSETTLKVAPILADAHLPIIASNATSDDLTGKWPYFFRVAVPNSVQIPLITTYIEQQLKSQRLVILRDPKETYSKSISDDLDQKFGEDGYTTSSIEEFTTGDKAGLIQQVQKVLKTPKLDVIFLATNRVGDVRTLLDNIPATAEYTNLKVFSGGAAYELVQPSEKPKGYERLYFSVSAFPDDWDILGSGNKPHFFQDQEYPAAYDPHDQHVTTDTYTYRRPNYMVMLTYDALRAFLIGSQGKPNPTREDIKNALSQMNGSRSFQGITGMISFDSDGNPINKAHFILHVVREADGWHHHLAAYQGCFLVSPGCDNSIHIRE